MIVTAQNQEIDQPIRHEIDHDPGTDDLSHVIDRDPALDQEHEHIQEIRMIIIGMQSQNHDRNQLIRIEVQTEDHVKNVIEPDRDQDRAIEGDTHLMTIQNLDRKKKRKRNIIRTTKEKITKSQFVKEEISVDVVTLSGMMTIGGRNANVMMMNRKKTVSGEVLDQSQSNLMKKNMSSRGKWQN